MSSYQVWIQGIFQSINVVFPVNIWYLWFKNDVQFAYFKIKVKDGVTGKSLCDLTSMETIFESNADTLALGLCCVFGNFKRCTLASMSNLKFVCHYSQTQPVYPNCHQPVKSI